MKNNELTELVFVIDRSGSMCSLTEDTIGGFNSMLKKQKQAEGKAFVTTMLFDTHFNTLHDRLPIEKVPEMTERDYVPGGCTALMDALGSTIRHIAQIHRYARPEDVPGQTVFVVITDGLENASREYTAERVRKMITHEQEKYGWEFVFLGANIDAVETAKHYGIREDRAVNYCADAMGTAEVYESVSDFCCCMRSPKPAEKELLDNAWRKKIDADYKARKR